MRAIKETILLTEDDSDDEDSNEDDYSNYSSNGSLDLSYNFDAFIIYIHTSKCRIL